MEAKDKIVLELDGKPPGRISLDPTNSKELKDLFARSAPGDEFKGTFTATLDEAGSKNITLSIQKFEVEPPEESVNPMQDIADTEAEDQEEAGEQGDSAAVTMMKNDDGVPEGQPGNSDDNMPGDIASEV
jgi:hypothetical protein